MFNWKKILVYILWNISCHIYATSWLYFSYILAKCMLYTNCRLSINLVQHKRLLSDRFYSSLFHLPNGSSKLSPDEKKLTLYLSSLYFSGYYFLSYTVIFHLVLTCGSKLYLPECKPFTVSTLEKNSKNRFLLSFMK